MDSSVSPKDEIWFLRVCHHIPNAVYFALESHVKSVLLHTPQRAVCLVIYYYNISISEYITSQIRRLLNDECKEKTTRCDVIEVLYRNLFGGAE